MSEPVIERLDPRVAARAELAVLLRDAVAHGASIGFMADPSEGEVEAFWTRVLGEAAAGSRCIWVARTRPGGPIVGSVQLGLESKANGRHRGEVQKLMVLFAERGTGLGAALMRALEVEAIARGLTLLVLDTSEGPGGAQKFYEKLAYTYCGGIPGYALDPDGSSRKNAIYCKVLEPRRAL